MAGFGEILLEASVAVNSADNNCRGVLIIMLSFWEIVKCENENNYGQEPRHSEISHPFRRTLNFMRMSSMQALHIYSTVNCHYLNMCASTCARKRNERPLPEFLMMTQQTYLYDSCKNQSTKKVDALDAQCRLFSWLLAFATQKQKKRATNFMSYDKVVP